MKLSVIIPVYNVEKYISKCIESILNQTFEEFEVILIDDGSNDNSVEICKKYALEDKRIKIMTQINKGVSSAGNKGLEVAEGKYIIFIDSDDWVENDVFRQMILMMDYYKADVGAFGHVIENNYENYLSKDECKEYSITIMSHFDGLVEQCKGAVLSYSVWGKIFTRNLIKNIKFNEKLSMGEDLLFSWEALKQSNKLVYNSYKGYHYLKRTGSLCNSKNNIKQIGDIYAWKIIYDDVKNDLELRKIVFNKYINILFHRLRAIVLIENIDCKNIYSDICNKYLKKELKNIKFSDVGAIKKFFKSIGFICIPYDILKFIYIIKIHIYK